MAKSTELGADELAIRSHDVVTCMENTRAEEYDTLNNLGLAVRLAVHLKGVPAQSYDLIRRVAVYGLNFQPSEVRPVLELLDAAEMIYLDTEGKTIKSVTPNIPFFGSLYEKLGLVATSTSSFSEPEQFTLTLMKNLADTPRPKEHFHALGADKKLIERVIDIGTEAAFIIHKRARGRDIYLSPSYFSENASAFADLVAAKGSGKVKTVLDLLKMHQGWPLSKLLAEGQLAGVVLDTDELAIVAALADDGFVQPPAIETTHAGRNYFLFAPRPGKGRLPLADREIYERAMALVAAVRQGQFISARFAIRSPVALLEALRDRKSIKANTEAIQQYRQVAKMRIGRLELHMGGWATLHLLDIPENIRAINLAIELIQGTQSVARPDSEIILALQKGQQYVESVLGRKRLVTDSRIIRPNSEIRQEVDSFLLRGGF